ncbi:hypothetical protein NDU88_007678 [Pleurodeles waltl]|uniref:Uncharacterized protein n=1 Tax=Pleurodeles waltl TaxID=8319 RepID=A0AAV7N2S4_PLEWA|nr:hypothetical protein NDU88_007678 [Pleurodeles waltl]
MGTGAGEETRAPQYCGPGGRAKLRGRWWLVLRAEQNGDGESSQKSLLRHQNLQKIGKYFIGNLTDTSKTIIRDPFALQLL